jgi:AsmA family protein
MAIARSIRRVLIWIAVGAAVLLFGLLGCALAIDAGYLRQLPITLLAADAHRSIQVRGAFHARVLSRHPQFIAEEVQIGNPVWMPPGITARIDRVTLTLAIPGYGQLLRIDRVSLEGATLNLVRQVNGNANWQLNNAAKADELPLIRSLWIPKAHTTLSDARRHLDFTGIVSVQTLPERSDASWLQILGNGQLNDVNVEFETISDPLDSATRRRPYRFSFAERSRTSQLRGRGSLTHAFDFDNLQTSFDATGENLKDLYALTGISLINSASYHLSGTLQRHGALSAFSDLEVTAGLSDISGNVSVDSAGSRPKLRADLHSTLLRLSDLGKHAADHDAATAARSPYLLSDATLDPHSVRHGEASVTFHLQRVDATRLSLHQLAGQLTIDHGILTVSAVTAQLLDGQVTGRWQMNATHDTLLDTLELHFDRLQIGQLDRASKDGPRYDALLNAQVNVTGQGSSAHQIAASANGHVSARVLSGTLRASLAELSGVDLRGLGLMLTRSRQQSAIRCGAADFDAQAGTLHTDDLLIDTNDVRIRGEGTVQLGTEALHVELRGHPYETRLLRMKAPVLLAGTLLHPHFGLEQPKSLQLIDRGSADVVNCQSLLAH